MHPYGKVRRWDISSVPIDRMCAAAEWEFACEYDGEGSLFDGVTLCRFDADGKIVSLKEFQSKAEHACPYGE